MDKQKLASMVKKCVNSMYREQAEKDLRKEEADMAEEEFGKEVMPKAKFNKLVRHAYKMDAGRKKEELEEIIDLIEELDV